ncbi:right-handed parallel beta-helix repeat-containing protein [bacterium]|jgi:hypothetical protein|nr:right-handed parallel beta-helix repeat-containing protein [bacterium]MBT4251622.1 right-handed parallel beta-helix repeat-containing protein [bacterium]MBT4597671.1 right-handed parallel beta-helix repeat-containing protein [bacterium]MBT6753684.1 right-handed parallel beta-helix repeat-containing protein [bacterium]MBT7037821.1 right-handed parallel beta-helix repeat-containing protein [bacterium]
MPLLKNLFIYLILFGFIFLVNKQIHLRISDYVINELLIPQKGIVFVNQSSKNNLENGSVEYPFKKISSALESIEKETSLKIIKIKKGIYEENLILPENIILSGETDYKNNILTIIQPLDLLDKGKVIFANNHTKLLNISVENGKYNVYIPQDKTGILISNCKISKATKWGIFNEIHSTSKPTLDIVKTHITKNRRQGVYLQKSTVTIKDSYLKENGEEGVDLHAGMKTYISNIEVIGNGEGGLETEIGNIDLVIENSIFLQNGASGINLQTFEGNSIVQISNNLIAKNVDFGIRCALHAPIKSPYFTKMVEISSDNVFEGNGKSSIDPICKKR